MTIYKLRFAGGFIQITESSTPKQISKRIKRGKVEVFEEGKVINWGLVEYVEVVPENKPIEVVKVYKHQDTTPEPQPKPEHPGHEKVKAHLEAQETAEAVETPEKVEHTVTVENKEIAPVYVSEKDKK